MVEFGSGLIVFLCSLFLFKRFAFNVCVLKPPFPHFSFDAPEAGDSFSTCFRVMVRGCPCRQDCSTDPLSGRKEIWICTKHQVLALDSWLNHSTQSKNESPNHHKFLQGQIQGFLFADNYLFSYINLISISFEVIFHIKTFRQILCVDGD